jgi:dienelactone hydrolase
MAEVLLFHHAHGLTSGCREFAAELRDAGHIVHLPDIYEGHQFDDLAEGLHYAETVGFDTIVERGRFAAEPLPTELVYGGFSLGVMPAQLLAQRRPGALGALLFHAAVPPVEFGGAWPASVPVQIHMMEDDDFALEGDLEVARGLAATVDRAELFLYPGDGHLFTDRNLQDFDPDAAELLRRRVLGFLAAIDR